MQNTQDDIQYFEAQKRIYPKSIKGKFRTLKWIIMALALFVYYGLPWVRYDRGAHAPDQAVLIDMIDGRGYFFFIEIWPQEVYYLTAILIVAAVGLFLITSLMGRVWCGYFCFQTIWTDLFITVEKLIQGDRNQRIRLDKAPLSFDKLWRKGLTHFLWICIGVMTGGAWVFYFNDAPTLMEQILHLDVPWSVGGWIIVLTGSTYLMAGYAREQVCTYMCPYARFQSAMYDKDTLVIGYNENIAEPRGHYKKGAPLAERGACIDCHACVQVCPVGIDIRDGQQMECISCGLCIDACDNIMQKVGFDKKLIQYDRLENFETKTPSESFRFKNFIRPRTFYYLGILVLVIGISLYNLANRAETELHVLHDRNPLFVRLSNGDIRNGYDIKILNKTHAHRDYTLTIEGIDYNAIRMLAYGQPVENIHVYADSIGHFRVFITASEQKNMRHKITITLQDQTDQAEIIEKTIFVSG
ncbi:MAG: cytochrome c oxidase accessory protein CcoG [Pseudomonadota bacterium]